ncbi:hypothetical protein SAMN04489867_1798 [Pedococcus dokdonensis]|jgi:hypothetical protein|uniref:WXG100 family type VII secretion target n=1 Tax=Pedococcus dokdonensis TaxID=443156 RepID=A0A1H0R060_9MICO|nr:hypothetical protein [Pedococcus dokdonensis]SDP22952.1 hypothetical protein SAMN04489867_1798 [Pedococcus dokdonensis]
MSTNIQGMDVEAAFNLVRLMTTDAEQIDSLSRNLTTQLHGTTWYGNDANTFRGDWDGQYVPTLQAITNALRENATTLQRQAEDQVAASS